MSIALVQPSLLLNSYAFTSPPFGGCGMFMDTTWNCPKNTRAQDIVNWILSAYGGTPARHLHHVVLNFHGPGEDEPGEKNENGVIYIGEAAPESGFGTSRFANAKYITLDLSNVGVFSALKSTNIGTIWFHSCAIAKDLKGKYLCQRVAECSGCKVVAAANDQYEYWGIINRVFMPRGSIDDYEGPVYMWEKGKVGLFYPNGGNWT